MGDDLLATIPFALGVLATLGLLHHLAAVALGDRDPRQIRRSVILMFLTVLFMTATLQRIRELGRPAAEPRPDLQKRLQAEPLDERPGLD